MNRMRQFVVLIILLQSDFKFVSSANRPLHVVQLTDELKQFILDYHNRQRRAIAQAEVPGQPSASDMQILTWNEQLAAKATEWASRCEWRHRPTDPEEADALCGVAGFHHVGENLAAGTFFSWENIAKEPTMFRAINASMDGWFDEYKVFQFPSTCLREPCGHYTQTSHVGCGLTSCGSITNIQWDSPAYYFVCNYGPGGNIYERGVLTPAYQVGDACTACPAETPTCTQGLCSGYKELQCVDKVTQWSCNYFKGRNMCDLCSPYFLQMQEECNKTCNLCGLEKMRDLAINARDRPSGFQPSGVSGFKNSCSRFHSLLLTNVIIVFILMSFY